MEPEESKALLTSRAGLNDPSSKELLDVITIVEDLSHLLLAIDQAAAYIRLENAPQRHTFDNLNIFASGF